MKESNSKKANYHHGNLREALITEAMGMLEEEGYEKIKLRAMSERVGTSRTALYRHFASKEALFQAVILRGFDMLDTILNPILQNGDLSISARIIQMGNAYMDFAVSRPSLYRLMMGEKLMRLREEGCDAEEEIVENAFDNIVSIILQGQKEKLFQEGDPQELATLLWSMVHGQVLLYIDGHMLLHEKREDVFRLGFEVFMRGVAL